MRYLVIFGLIFFKVLNLKAQNSFGQYSSTYSGVHALGYNPAEIADSRYKFHASLLSLSAMASNTLAGISSDNFPIPQDAGNDSLKRKYYPLVNPNGMNAAYAQVNQVFGLMYSVNEKVSFALHGGFNVNVAANGIDGKLGRYIYDNRDTSSYGPNNSNNLNASIALYGQIGLTMAAVLKDGPRAKIKLGLTPKIYMGLFGMYAQAEDIDMSLKDSRTIAYLNGPVKMQYYGSTDFDMSSLFSSTSFGFDLGGIYEIKDRSENYTYEMDCKTDNIRHDLNKYKVRFGLSILDVGGIDFKSNVPISKLTFDSSFFRNVATNKFNEVLTSEKFIDSANSLKSMGLDIDSTRKTFSINAPTRVHFFVDYKFSQKFYLGLQGTYSLQGKDNGSYMNTSWFGITPRFEHKLIGLYLPIQYHMLSSEVNVGFGARLLFLNIGVTDILPFTRIKSTTKNVGVHVSVNIPILKRGKKKDSDNDLMSDKKDKCHGQQGTCEDNGCPPPDTDEDGVPDKVDECPRQKGSAETNGCPDTDKDGIADKDDLCPRLKGPAENKGCPDTDNDGIIDLFDKCPKQAGLKELDGCPDKDGDLVSDETDGCPDVPGPISNKGCPEVTADQLNTSDLDEDGVPDAFDLCPFEKGNPEHKGCPKDKKPVEDKNSVSVANDLQKNLQFETGKSKIHKMSFYYLNLFVVMMKDNPKYKVSIEGHTDNRGNSETNKKLAESRAKAVEKYLIDKGVSVSRITSRGIGDAEPIADNETESGRAQNRRVEIKIFE
ncbi:MAG: DUF5723 family protein [Chitinophagales bacterium]|jgi:outer membrane protein OmpA-like peptidoglycan-associated protein|nr:DUF5723 family protein [Chitinophagales bacterium]